MVAFNKTTLASLSALAGTQVHMIADFRGNFLNLFQAALDGTPVITQPLGNAPVTANQLWLFDIVETIFTEIESATGTFLSYPGGAFAGSLLNAPATSNQESDFRLQFFIDSVTGGSTITEAGSGLALTAWQSASNISTSTPVTYAPLVTGAKEQIWTISTITIPSIASVD